jgi:uncharacterized protein involved in outer membrane biogenesis
MTRKRKFGYAGLVLVGLLAVTFLFLNFYLGSVVKAAVESVGPKAIGAPVTITSVKARLLRGLIEIKGVHIGNPEGFKTPAAVTVGLIRLDFEPLSMLTSKIHIREIAVEAPEITYEIGMGGSNIGQIQKNVAAFTGADQAKPETAKPAPEPAKPAGPAKPGKKVVIDHFVVSGGEVQISATFMGGKAIPVPLPTVEMRDIGKDKDTSMADATGKMFNAVLAAIANTATAAVSGLGDGAKAIGGAAAGAGKAVGDGASSLFNSLKKAVSK